MPTMAKEIMIAIERMKKEMIDGLYLGFHKIDLENASYVIAKMHGFVLTDCGIEPKVKSHPNVMHHPILVPYHLLADCVPTRVKDTIDFLEEFPELSDKPIFDHFRVLVPGVRCLSSTKSQILDTNKKLIKEKEIVPILLGECDGRHYFICYWM